MLSVDVLFRRCTSTRSDNANDVKEEESAFEAISGCMNDMDYYSMEINGAAGEQAPDELSQEIQRLREELKMVVDSNKNIREYVKSKAVEVSIGRKN